MRALTENAAIAVKQTTGAGNVGYIYGIKMVNADIRYGMYATKIIPVHNIILCKIAKRLNK